MLQIFRFGSQNQIWQQNQQPNSQFSRQKTSGGVFFTACFDESAALNKTMKEEQTRTSVGLSLFVRDRFIKSLFYQQLLVSEVETTLMKAACFSRGKQIICCL